MRRQLLAIGIDTYTERTIGKLRFAREDAVNMRGVLQNAELAFKHVTPPPKWTDRRARKAIKQSVSKLRAGDLFVFYFAGHGVQSGAGGRHLLLCEDASHEALTTDSTNGCISFQLLAEMCRGPFDRVFIFDACRGPYLAEKSRGGGAPGNREMTDSAAYREIVKVAEPGGDTGRTTVIWSCADGETAAEDPRKKGGVFTAALLECLREARDKEGSVLLDEAFIAKVRARMGLGEVQQPNIVHPEQPIRLELRKTPSAAIDRREAALSALPPLVAPEHKNASVPDTPPTPPAEGKKEGWFERLLRRATMVTAVLAVIFTAIAALEFAGFSTLRLFWPDIGIQRSLPPQQGSGPAMMETGEAAPTQPRR